MTGAKQRRSLEEAIVDTVREPLIVLDDALRVVIASRSSYRAFGVTPQESEGRLFYELGDGQWDIPALRELLAAVVPHHTTIEDFEVEHDFPTIGRKIMLLNARKVFIRETTARSFWSLLKMSASAVLWNAKRTICYVKKTFSFRR